MATSKAETFPVDDVRVCSICFEKFKTPRYLPCKHSFCSDCLSSYIVSQCKSTEPRLGFHCPLCRVYIPSDGVPGEPEKWAKLYPINVILQNMGDHTHDKQCEPCLRDSEINKASDYCLSCEEYICMNCAKCHKKNMASLNHTIVLIQEMNMIQIVPEIASVNFCPKHKHEKIQLYCHDHEQLCCCLCGSTEHRKCDRVDTLEDALNFFRENGLIDTLLKEINIFKEKLQKAKTDGDKIISDIDCTVDNNVGETENECLVLVQHMEKLKVEYIDKLLSTAKISKEKLQREIEKLEDGIFCVDNCKSLIENANSSKSDIETLRQFFKAKEKFQHAKFFEFRQMNSTISVSKTPLLKKFAELKSIADIHTTESFCRLNLYIETMELIKFKDFTIADGNIFSGIFISGGRFLILNHKENGPCYVYDKNWKCLQDIGGLHLPFDAVESNEEIFVTNMGSNTVEVLSSTDFHKLRSIPLQDKVSSITCVKGTVYVSCGSRIIKLDKTGQILRKYELNENTKRRIIGTTSGLIVYSECKLGTVSAMTEEDVFAWTYQRGNLIHPSDLDADLNDNIYVAGRYSNNIHVLSISGELIRLIENIHSPMFCKINSEGVFCVCSEKKHINVYKIRC